MEKVRVEARTPVLVVTIDRPEVRNAVDSPTARALAEAFRSFEADDSLSVAVLTGAAGTFCSGFDLKALAADPERANAVSPEGDGPMGPTRMATTKPVIAAIEGYAVAGGLELALWCDLRVAASDAVLGVFNRRFGVPLVDGGTVRLARIVGQGRALDLVLTGRPIDAAEALSMGLVNRVTEPGGALDEAVVLAERVAAFPQGSLRADRRSLLAGWGLGVADAMTAEFEAGIQAVASGESQSGARRFAEGEGRAGAFE